jgi:hypothetical protein
MNKNNPTDSNKEEEAKLPYMDNHFMEQSTLYKEFLAERDEILKHKWIESEKEGTDIGFERALLDWIRKHREKWRRYRTKK